jgi:hypothetical protein
LERGGFEIPLANSENGTVQGAVATWCFIGGDFQVHQVATAPCTVPIRQQYLKAAALQSFAVFDKAYIITALHKEPVKRDFS